ncbi:ATP-binding protein [Streptomyces sp. NBC_00704]|uniref:hypothetical protein n=1 Tax=Streptomyces sp. NBC_00704 TaxID=2975809 RepID=UPI002E33729C|nr:hypothetical protein [Streptomyces sp. NBC_00704]
MRSETDRCASEAGVAEEQRRRPAVAVTEIATNSVRHGGGGLWLAPQLCDLVAIRSGRDHATTIRLRVDVPR